MSSAAETVSNSVIPHEILIGYNLIDGSQKGMECARSLARRFGWHVTVAHVNLCENGGTSGDTTGNAALDQVVDELRADGVNADRSEHWGWVSGELQGLARAKSADLLVLGTKASHRLERLVPAGIGDRYGWPVMIAGPCVFEPFELCSPGTVACFVENTMENVSAVAYGYRMAQELGTDFKLFAVTSGNSEMHEFTGGDLFRQALADELPDVDIRREIPVRKIWHTVAADYMRLRLKMHDLGVVVVAANDIGPLHFASQRDLLSDAIEAAECPVIVVARTSRHPQS